MNAPLDHLKVPEGFIRVCTCLENERSTHMLALPSGSDYEDGSSSEEEYEFGEEDEDEDEEMGGVEAEAGGGVKAGGVGKKATQDRKSVV